MSEDIENQLKEIRYRLSEIENTQNKILNAFNSANQAIEYTPDLVCSCGVIPSCSNPGDCSNTECPHGLN